MGTKKKKNKIKIMVYMIINIYRERLKKYTSGISVNSRKFK